MGAVVCRGLAEGGFALIFKTHHALVDGIAGVDLATVLLDLDATAAAAARGRMEAGAEPGHAGPRRARRGRRRARRAHARRLRGRRGALAGRDGPTHERRRPGARRGGLGDAQPRPANTPQRADRPGPALCRVLGPARRLPADQEHVRGDRERRAARGRDGRPAALPARARGADRGPRAARARPRLDPLLQRRRERGRARQPPGGDAGAAAGAPRRPARARWRRCG